MGAPAADELSESFNTLPIKARVAAVDCLGRAKSQRAPRLLLKLLSDPDRDIRARAAHSLGLIGDPNFTPDLLKCLHDTEWPVRAMAAKALGRIRFQGAIPALSMAVRDPEWWVRANAAEALRQMGHPGIEALEVLLDDADVFARHQAVLMLEEAGVLDERIEALSGPDSLVRRRAEDLVGKLMAAGQVGRLRELEVIHPDPAIRRALGVLRERAQEPAETRP